jgi:HlyD family secretion protein
MTIVAKRWIPIVSAAALIGGFVAFTHRGHPQPQYFTEKVERGDIRDAVEVTGTVNPVVAVQVGSQVSGTIATLSADFNSRVHKGEVIARIDPSLLNGALQQAVADSESAVANVAAARAGE